MTALSTLDGMALLYRAKLRPSKIELVAAWAPIQPWFDGSATAPFTSIASFRFDDPDGEVGIETLIVRVGEGHLFQLPLTYRGAPLAGGSESLIGMMEHSVLGRRWVYDATGDPVYLAAVVAAAFTGAIQAEEYFEMDGEKVVRESTAHVVGSGHPGASVPSSAGPVSTRHEFGTTVVDAGDLRIIIARALDTTVAPNAGAQESLVGTWADQADPRTLVWTSGRS